MFAVLRCPGAVPFFLAVLINAVIDLGHKVTLQNIIFKVHDGAEQVVLTAIINALILLPYVLFFAPIGWFANRTPKPRMMRIAAIATVGLVGLLMLFYQLGWFWAAFATTFLMSVQSAFYSPAKLGYLKTLFDAERLLQANGLAQSVVIFGILCSTVVFSLGFESIYASGGYAAGTAGALVEGSASFKGQLLAEMWPLVIVIIVLSLLQLWMVYRIPVLAEDMSATHGSENPEAAVMASSIAPTRPGILLDAQFRIPILALALFWALGQSVLAIFPAFAKDQAGITNTAVIQSILACTGLGVFIGAWLVGHLSRPTSKNGFGVAIAGMLIMIVGLFTLPLFRQPLFYAIQFILIGVASGMLIVPCNTYLQMKASGAIMGSVITTSNLLQNIAMLCTLGLTIAVAIYGVSPIILIVMVSGLAALAALLLIPRLRRLPR